MEAHEKEELLGFKLVGVIIVMVIFLMIGCFYIGKASKQNEIEARVWPIQKDCYNQQDLEIIIFGEIQE
jgi:hypothetical protein